MNLPARSVPVTCRCRFNTYAQYRSRRPHPLRQLDGRVAETAPHVQHLVALAHLQRGEDLGAMVGQAIHQDVTEPDELGNEDVVPEIDELRAGIL